MRPQVATRSPSDAQCGKVNWQVPCRRRGHYLSPCRPGCVFSRNAVGNFMLPTVPARETNTIPAHKTGISIALDGTKCAVSGQI